MVIWCHVNACKRFCKNNRLDTDDFVFFRLNTILSFDYHRYGLWTPSSSMYHHHHQCIIIINIYYHHHQCIIIIGTTSNIFHYFYFFRNAIHIVIKWRCRCNRQCWVLVTLPSCFVWSSNMPFLAYILILFVLSSSSSSSQARSTGTSIVHQTWMRYAWRFIWR